MIQGGRDGSRTTKTLCKKGKVKDFFIIVIGVDVVTDRMPFRVDRKWESIRR